MKKINLLFAFLSLGIVASLASCGEEPITEEEHQKAVQLAMSKRMAQNSAGDPIYNDEDTILKGNESDYLRLTTKSYQPVNGKNVEVNYRWFYDENNEDYAMLFDKWVPIEGDDQHMIINFNYSAEEDMEFKLNVEVTSGNANGLVEYTLILQQKDITFTPYTLEEFYTVDAGTGRYSWQKADGTIQPNNIGKYYHYAKTQGKVVYLAEDNNFGIFADGEYYAYLFKMGDYAGQFKVGDYIQIEGEISLYYGAIQFSFISKLDKLEDHSMIAEPAAALTVTGSLLSKDSESKIPERSGYHMRHVVLNGATYKDIVDANGEQTAIANGKRFRIQVEEGGYSFEIAYDYHTGTKSKLGDTLIALANSCTAGVTKLNLDCYMIYNNGDNSVKNLDNSGEWQLLPINADSVKIAA